jgi:predicted nucleotidyltransferase
MSHRTNVTRIKAVYNALGNLKDTVVFIGGATVSLYADRMAEEVRPTDDVDVLVEIYTLGEYAALENKLRDFGFKNDTSAKFVGRFLLEGLIVDIMSMTAKISGEANKWYSDGLENAITYTIDEQHIIKIFSAPYFIATKIEAFKDRGEGDGRTSKDFEDIVFILENRNAIWQEMNSAPEKVRKYLKEEFKAFLNNPDFEEWLYSHSSSFSPPSTYFIIDRLEKFVGKKPSN